MRINHPRQKFANISFKRKMLIEYGRRLKYTTRAWVMKKGSRGFSIGYTFYSIKIRNKRSSIYNSRIGYAMKQAWQMNPVTRISNGLTMNPPFYIVHNNETAAHAHDQRIEAARKRMVEKKGWGSSKKWDKAMSGFGSSNA